MYGYTTADQTWDAGVDVRWYRAVEPQALPIGVTWVRDHILHGCNDDAEDDEIELWIGAAVRDCEAFGRLSQPQRAVMPQTWTMVLSGFPCQPLPSPSGPCPRIVLPVAPLLEVLSVGYLDTSGTLQELALSPAGMLVLPSGPYTAGEIRPLAGQAFPTTSTGSDVVTVTWTAGYRDQNSPALKHVLAGIGLFVSEMYTQRTLSTGYRTGTPAFKIDRFWAGPF